MTLGMEHFLGLHSTLCVCYAMWVWKGSISKYHRDIRNGKPPWATLHFMCVLQQPVGEEGERALQELFPLIERVEWYQPTHIINNNNNTIAIIKIILIKVNCTFNLDHKE